ncbi:hypothetical protein [Lysobacter tyrosinilyticus]
MKQVVFGLVATFAIGTAAAAQQPDVLVRAKGAVTVQASGSAQVGDVAVPSDSSVGAKAGDLVSVSDGIAKVTYDNGCTVKVEAGKPYTISEKAPVCRSPVVASTSDTKYYLMAGGAAALLVAGAAGGGGGSDDKPSSP